MRVVTRGQGLAKDIAHDAFDPLRALEDATDGAMHPGSGLSSPFDLQAVFRVGSMAGVVKQVIRNAVPDGVFQQFGYPGAERLPGWGPGCIFGDGKVFM